MKFPKTTFPFALILALMLFNTSCRILKKDAPLSERRQLENSSLFIDALHLKYFGNNTEALNLLQRIAESDPRHAASRYEIARIYASQLDYNNAILFIKQAIKINPQNKWYQMFLIDVYDRIGNHALKIPIYNQLIKENPKDMSLYFGLANTYLQMNDINGALKILNDIESKTGISQEVSIQKYQLYILKRDNKSALQELKKLSQAFPEETAYALAVADFYLQTGNYYEAIQHYSAVYERDNTNYEALISLAECYMRIGNKSKATELFERLFSDPDVGVDAKMNIMLYYYEISEKDTTMKQLSYELLNVYLSTHPNDPKVHSIYADFLFRDKRYSEAAMHWQQVIELDPSKYIVWEYLFKCYDALQQYDTLAKTSIEATDIFPEQPAVFFYAGYAFYQQKQFHKSIEYFERAVELALTENSILTQSLSYLAETYHSIGAHEQSDNAFQRLIDMNPKNYWALNNYSYYLSLRKERLDDALKMSEKTIKAQPTNPSYLDTYGWILYQMGNYEESEKYLKKAVEYSQTPKPKILENYGDVLMKLGRFDESLHYWKLSIEAGGNKEELYKKIEQFNNDK